MIKYFCDRCGRELTSYEYENRCTTLSLDIASNGRYSYKLCDFCAAQFGKFISGEEVKRVEKVKEK